jgi:threonine dehydrogenase-like Zn-dependent dehydrogenase
VDVAIEAVGMPQTVTDALNVIRPYATVSIVGLSEAETMNFEIRAAYLNGTRLAIGTCSVQLRRRNIDHFGCSFEMTSQPWLS